MTVRATGSRSCLIGIVMAAALAVASPSRAIEPTPKGSRLLRLPASHTVARPAAIPIGIAHLPWQTADRSPSPVASRPWWGWLLLGRLHPMVVHFPIALLTAAAMVEAWHALRRRPVPSEAGTYCLAFGVAGAVAAVCLGTLNASHQAVTGDAATALERHQVMGWISTMAAMAALGAGQVARRTGRLRTMAVYVALLLATGAVVGATGHLGGGLVYGERYLTGVLPWNQGAEATASLAASPVAPAAVVTSQGEPVDFTRDVMPLIKRTCVECHGPDKVKARLRMDSVEGLQKGGKSGALLKPGDPENSLIMRRVLGLDGEDQMPLDNDPLTEKQIDTLRRWIAAGAPYPAAGSQ